MCSPSEGYCCNPDSCQLHSDKEFLVCRKVLTNINNLIYCILQESECSEAQTCDGLTAQCPQSDPKPDGLPCQDSTKVFFYIISIQSAMLGFRRVLEEVAMDRYANSLVLRTVSLLKENQRSSVSLLVSKTGVCHDNNFFSYHT